MLVGVLVHRRGDRTSCPSAGSSASSATSAWRCSSTSRRRASSTPTGATSADGFVPGVAERRRVYWYFVVGLIAAALMPYEIYFYSSGRRRGGLGREGSEGQQGQRDHRLRPGRAAQRRAPGRRRRRCLSRGDQPGEHRHGRARGAVPYGELGLLLAFVGILFAVGGRDRHRLLGRLQPRAVQGWKWGKRFRLLDEPRFTPVARGLPGRRASPSPRPASIRSS